MIVKSTALHRLLEVRAAAPSDTFEGGPDDAGRPLSFAQQRLWFLQQLAPNDTAYNAPFAQRLRGPLDVEALRRAIEHVIQRHEALRTAFPARDGVPRQVVYQLVRLELHVTSLASIDAAEREAAVAQLIAEESARPFDLGERPPLRTWLLRLADNDHVLVISMHHVLIDEASFYLMWREVCAAYAAFVDGQAPALAPVKVQYPDYAAKQRARITDAVLKRHLAFWTHQLTGAPARTELPYRHARLRAAASPPREYTVDLGAETTRALRDVAKQGGTTLFMAGLAALRAVLARTTGQDDLCIGAPISTRNRPELRQAIGFFVNTLALRTPVDMRAGFGALLRRERETMLDAFERQETPFEAIVNALGLERDATTNPLFQISFTHHPPSEDAPRLGPVDAVQYEVERSAAQFDIEVETAERGESLEIRLSYKSELFEAWVIEGLAHQLACFIREAVRAPELPIARVPLVDAGERRQLIDRWSAPEHEANDLTLRELFEAQVDRTPDATALVLGEARLTYRELDERANRIAAALRAHDVGPERVVGVAIERSFDQVAAIIGVIKTGGAWVPLEPTLPTTRLRYIAEVSRARAVVTTAEHAREIGELALPIVDVTAAAVTSAASSRGRVSGVTADHLAYVLFTSGSTGQPKGVMVTHRGIRNELAVSNHALLPMGPGEALLALAPFTFDQSVHEMWWPLVNGATLVLVAEGEQRDPQRVVERIQQGQVTVLELVPTLLRTLVADRGLARCPSLRLVAAGGEALTLDLMRAFYAAYPQLGLINGYGPTETAVTVCNWRCVAEAEAMVIGDAWANVQFRVLDDHGEPVPLGVAGELFIGGIQLARGYASRPDLTAERFVPDPYAAEPGRRMYRTGDRVRRLPDGTIEFLGRVDAQVKLRGFRIELGEIEASILANEAVAQCAVAIRPSARGEQLVAYLVLRSPIEIAAVRASLAGQLPEYMIPAAYVELEALPLTPSGKLDRRGLPAPSEDAFERAPMLAPRTPDEEAIAKIWREVLGIEEVGVRDDFFARGGHSLLAVQVVARIRAELDATITLAQLFRTTTIEGLAQEIAQRSGSAAPAPTTVTAVRSEPLLLSYAQQRLWLVDQMTPGSAYHMPSGRRLQGALDVEALRRAFEDIVRRHEVLHTVFPSEDGLPRQHILPLGRWELPLDDLSALAPGEREAQLARISREDAEARFDLATGPLVRTRLVRLAPDDHVVLVTMHHIVSDGSSYDVFWREVVAYYEDNRQGRPHALAELPLQYADYAAQQRAAVSGEALEAHLAYWKQHLAGAPAETALPRRSNRGASQGHAGSLVLNLDADTTRALRELGKREGATLFMILLAAFRAVLARTSGQDDLVIGTPISGRDRPEIEGLIGLFVNTLVLRSEVDRSATFAELVRRERETVLAAHAHQDAPFEMIVDELGVDRRAARSPIFQIWFVQESVGHVRSTFGEALTDEVFSRELSESKFELSVYINESRDGVELALLFDTGVFARHVIDGIGDRFRAALEIAGRAPDRSFADIELGAPPAGSDPRVAIAKRAYPHVLEVVEELARTGPVAPALRHAGRELTRSQLWAASTGVVDALTRAGIQPGDRVALAGPPSVGLIAGYLGILRHGACLVPLSSRLSREHVERLLEHVGARVILEATGGTPRTSSVPTAAIDHATGAVTLPPAVPASTQPTDPAIKYIYFTSGTTGAQKGVIGNLVALGHFSAWQRAQFGEVAGAVSAQLTELGFDVFLRDTMFALTSGKLMALPPNEVAELEPVELLRWLEREGVTAIHSVPSLLRTWLNAAPPDVSLRALRCIFLVGEPLDATLVERWRARFGAHTEIVNLYGTTETGPAKCWYRVPHPPEPGIQPAGWPLPETQILVMRDPRSLAAIGEVGEVVIRTPFSTLGYLDAATGDEAPKFFSNPFRSDPDDRLYRTGDLGRYRNDGTVEIIGRSDDQVKLRGQRVDPSGIAAALRTHRGVADGAVIAAKLSADDVRLIAYVVRAEPAPSTADLREHLRQTIPPYMIPASFVFLTALPRKANGKLDRAALPAPDWDAGDEDMFVPPRSPEEETIAAIWRDVLNIQRIGVRDDFFALGGHSLLAVLVTSRLRALLEVDVGIQRFFEAPTIEGLAANIVRLRAGAQPDDAPPPIAAVPRTGELPLSFAQQRLWFLHRLAPTSPAYHVPLQRRIRGRLAVEALRRAFEEVVHRHESLRTVFPSAGGVPLQRITPPARWELPVEDLGGLAGAERDAAIEHALRDASERPFDLATGPLFRTKLVRLADDDHVVLVTLHHIISDGWSMSVMWTEVADLYRHFATGAPSRLPALPIQYADYAAWQRAWLSGATLERQLAYWIDQLRDAPSETALPLKGPRPAVSTARGGMVAFELDAELSAGIKSVNKATRSTNFVTLLAAFRAVFARISGQDDLCIGSPIASRNRHELEHVIGIVLNTLVLRTPLAAGESFTELVKRERANALAAFAHQEAPFEMIVDALKIERSLNRTPLFQISFVHQNLPQAPPAIGDLLDEPFHSSEITTRFDLSIVSFERDGKIQIELVYNLDLFDRWQIDQLAAQFLHFLREALREPSRPVAAIPIASADDRRQLVTAWNQPAEAAPRELTIPSMFEAQVDRSPEATALVLGDAQLTYGELDERANRIAHALRARGIRPETIVGISLERSFDLVAAILGVSKAGGAWVPLDPHLPAARLAAISELARPAAVIDAAWLGDVSTMPASRPTPLALAPDHLAYVLFTSGSTGQPKGVMIPHRGIVNELISAQTLRAQLGASDRFLQLAPYTFDLSVHEMLWPLTTGAAVVLLPEGAHREPRRILDEMRARRVTIMHPVPALLRALMAEGDALDRCTDLRIMCSGGEALPLDVLHAFVARRPDVTLINSYGPTEASVTVSGWRARPDATGVAIGLPYLGTQMYVLDEGLEPAPLGIAGELYIGGAQLARGYAAQAALTAAAFVPDPFSTVPGARMYRTGDRVRRWPDGNVEILGRVDRQVKLRGFRIELGEIEAVMREHAGVREAAVTVHGTGPDARLVAYVVPASVSADGVRAFLAARLPEYMVPRAVLGLDALPLNRSGKLDRSALPAPDDEALARDRYEAPRTPLEELLAGIWSELLGVERISRTANFFDLGGHSLLAARLAWEAKTTIATVFAAPTIAGLASAIEAQATDAATAPPSIVAIDRLQPLALSHAQQRMWFLHQLAPTSPAYHMSLGRRLRGTLDVEALRRAFEDVIARHEVLRSTFPVLDGVPRVAIRAPGTWQLPVVDLTARAPAERDAELDRISSAETERPFDLATGPLVRTLLVRLSPAEHVVLVTLHHIVFDGHSIGLWWHEVEELYSARVEMRRASLTALPVQYVDHAHWQRGWLTGDVLDGQLAFWKDHLHGAPEDTALPFKGPRPPVQTHDGASHALTLSPELVARVRALTRTQGSTLFITLLAAFRALLLRYTGQDDICIGAPTANRKQRDVESLMGLFVNTVVFRTPATGTTTFAELLEQERATALAAFAHADTPLEMVIEQLHITRSLSRNPLFQVMFQVMFADAGQPDVGFSGLAFEHLERGLISTHVDLDVSAIVAGDRIDLVFVYNTDLFDPAVIAQMTGHFEALLSAALADPDVTLAELGMLAAPEQERLLAAWNRTARDVPRATLPALIAERIAKTPDAIAIEAGGRTLTYRALAEQRNRVARYLLQLGLAPEERVGICLDRGPELVIAMLAVLEAGAAYLPLDSELPADRLAYMVEDARVRIVLTQPDLRDRVGAEHHVIVDFAQPALADQSPAPLGRSLAPEQLAYVLYTSGSTGRPKGVQIQHASLVNFLVSMLDAPGLTERDTLLAVTTASFDISGLELYLPLLAGARLVIASRDEARDGVRLMRLLADQRVTTMQATPATWRMLVELGWRPRPGFVALCGGEALPPDLAAALTAQVGALWNLYGPTETTIWSARKRLEAGVPIRLGEPIANTQLYILDPVSLRPQPLEVAGELYIAGDGLARGYGDRPELTASRFVPDPFAAAPGARMYRTGDLARRRTDGELEFLGRIDHQVKIRGFRIELGEIEAVLAEDPRVAEVVVVVREDGGEPRLVAYVVSLGTPPAIDALQELARARLPDYMVPAAVVFLDELPLSPAGKIDRRALPAPDRAAFGGAGYVAPRDSTEELLADIWAQLLGVERVGIYDDFFELGGQSLLAIRVIAAIRTALGVEVPVHEVFFAPVLADLARTVGRLRGTGQPAADAPPALRPVARGERLPLSFAQQRLWFLHQLEPESPLYILANRRRHRRLDAEALRRAVETIVHRHEGLRTTYLAPDGAPYQHVNLPSPWVLDISDARVLDAAAQTALLARIEEDQQRPFDLATGPLLRTHLVRLPEDEDVLFVTFHHIAVDGWSQDIFWRELWAAYDALIAGGAVDLPSLPMQYVDYAAWQRGWLVGAELQRQLGYWTELLRGAPEELALPLKGPRPPAQTFACQVVVADLGDADSKRLRALAHAEGVTLFMVLAAALRAVLARYSGQADVVLGTAITNRNATELEGVIGMFVNTLVLRNELRADDTFTTLLAREKARALAAYAHQHTPFELVVDALGAARNLSRTPVFQVMYAHQGELGADRRGQVLDGPPIVTSSFDLTLQSWEEGELLGLDLIYNVDLFDPAMIEQLLRHFRRLVASVLDEPHRPLASIDLLDAQDHAQLDAWNATPSDFGVPPLLQECIAAQVARAPDAIAIVDDHAQVTYRELDAHAARVAGWLVARGVSRGDRVALSVERSADMVAALLGVLRTGATYVPIDPEYPEHRRELMRRDAGAVLELTDAALHEALASTATAPAVQVDPSDVAYMIYTSGSTGTPKGVLVPHRSLANYIAAMRGPHGITSVDTAAGISSLSFDAHVIDILLPLANGARVALADRDTMRDGERLARLLEGRDVTFMFATPATWRALLATGWRPSPRLRLHVGGEAVSPTLIAALEQAESVWHVYGPTETTVYASYTRHEPGHPVTIGRPLPSLHAYVLDDAGQLAPIGVAGELFIGGANVTLGYHARPGLTAERFLPDPFVNEPGACMYRTGDRVRWSRAGLLEFLGRVDTQIKLRGLRIELGEIEAAIRAHASVSDVVVMLREDVPGNPQIVAYLATGAPFDEVAARAALRSALPDYMVPSAFVALPAFPLSPNGKIDRKALPAPTLPEGADYEAPRDEIETALVAIWREVLAVERVSLHDDFFALGGHSLLVTQVVTRIRTQLRVPLPVRAVFEDPTVERLAVRVRALATQDTNDATPPLIAAPRGEVLTLSYAQQSMWLLQQLEPTSVAYNMASTRWFEGTLDVEALRRAVEQVVHRHESLRTRFPAVDGEPRAEIDPPGRWDLAYADHRGITDAKLRELVAHLLGQPFDLATGPMLRTHLVHVRDDAHVFVLSLHHIAGDGWSMDVLWRELGELYAAAVAGRAPALTPLPIQYADYAAWQRTRLAGGELERQLRYWTETLRGAPTETALPFKGPRPSTPLSLDHRLTLRLDAELADGLRALAQQRGATMFMTLLAAFRALLARYTGQHDLVIGTPVANRNRRELEGMIGLFLNTLALRGEVRADDSFEVLLAREKAIALGAYEHQETPIELITDTLALERRPDLNPLFQVWFVHQNTPRHTPTLGGYAEVLGEDAFEGKSKFDISLYSIEDGRDIVIDWHFKPELLDPATMERMIAHYRAVLVQVIADATVRVDALLAGAAPAPRYAPDRELLPAPGYRRLDASGELGVWHAFEAQAREHADRLAIADGDQRWTYRELEQRATAIASQLLETNVRRVALLFPHGADMVAAMLGALGAGALYVPLDSEHPADRLRAIITDSEAEVIICSPSNRELAQSLGAPRVVVPSDAVDAARLRRPHAAADDVAYILYTSGSTGLPKGVFQSQRNVAHHAVTYANNVGIGPGDRVALLATYAFDAAVMDIYGALLTGATLYPWSVRTLGFEQLGGWIEREGITLLHGTPTVFREIVAEAARASTAGQDFARVRAVVLGGEAVGREDLELFRRHFPATSVLVNGLGPTESTLALQAFLAPADGLGDRNTVPVGYPVSPATEVLLDTPLGRQLAVYGVGELVIQSKHVALGYWKRPAETAAAFGAGPEGSRRYHTGDLGRRLPDGRIEFVGRRDTQVKLRGVRIELGEIEAVLASCIGVASCAVVLRGQVTDPMLVAFVAKTPQAEALTVSDLSAQLATRLPAYMVPPVIVFLAAMPLTTTGKVARKLLPEVDLSALERGTFVAPRTPEEQALAEIWREMLGVERVGAHDNFFKLGGNSLMALRLVSRIRAKLSVSLPVRSVFTSPALDALATMLKPDPAKQTVDTSIEFVPTTVTEAAATTVQQYFYYLDRDDHDPLSYYSPLVIEFEGPLDVALMAQTYDELVRAHSVYRTAFREVFGQLRQYVLDIDDDRPPRLEIDDRGELPEEAWNAELTRAQTELAAKAYDLAEGRGLIRARLVRLNANRHALMVLRHHIASDGGAGQALTGHLYDNYLSLVAGKGSAPPPALQAIDFVDAHQKWARTPAGQAQEKLWKERLRDQVPVELEGDFPRAAIDARRDALPLGIAADQSYPPQNVALPSDAYAAVVAAAAEAQTSAFVVFATALVWLLHERSHQDDISLQTSYSQREQDLKLADVHGALVSWSVLRVDLRGVTSFKEAILRTKSFVDAMYESGPPYDYYDAVPHRLRRVAFNYLPQVSGGGAGDDASAPPPVVTISRRVWPFPPWKRPWDLHLTLVDTSTSARLVWTGFEKLFRRETIVALLDRYIEILRGAGG